MFDDSADEVRIYIDGELDHTESGVTVTPSTNDHPLVLGQRGDGEFWFDGAIDEVMVWSRTLSDAEIADLHDAVLVF